MIKKLSKFIKGYWKYTIITPLAILFESLLEIVIPYVMADLIDKGIYAGSMPDITKYGLILLGAAFVSLIFGVLAGITAPIASAGFASNLRHAMYYKVQDFSFASIDKFSTASIVTRLTTDVNNVQQAFQMLTRICFRAPSMVVFALIAAFKVNRKLALVFLAATPVLLIGMAILSSSVHPIFERVFKKYDKLNNVVRENVHGMRVVKSFNRQDHETKKFKESSEDIFLDFSKAEKIMAWMMPLMMFATYLCMILICWFGSKMIIASGNNAAFGLTTGQFMSMISYTTQILMSLMMVSMVFVMLLMARASAQRIIEVLDETNEICNPEKPVMDVESGAIDFENVSFEYKHEDSDGLLTEGKNAHKYVLENINLHIDSGDVVGVIGATGSSKSSLVQLIPRLYDATSGSVRVGGRDVRDYDIEALRNSVAMVLQKNVLFSGTIRENLRWGNPDATEAEMIHACQVACADEFINTFEKGYDTYIEQGGANVSGGQRQRLCIARALLKNPRILILDDSTSAVDMKTDAKIRKAFKDELPDVTKIIIAQRIASVTDSDKIVIMDSGRIIASGTHDELMNTSDIYREIYETQNKISEVDIDVEGGEM